MHGLTLPFCSMGGGCAYYASWKLIYQPKNKAWSIPTKWPASFGLPNPQIQVLLDNDSEKIGRHVGQTGLQCYPIWNQNASTPAFVDHNCIIVSTTDRTIEADCVGLSTSWRSYISFKPACPIISSSTYVNLQYPAAQSIHEYRANTEHQWCAK